MLPKLTGLCDIMGAWQVLAPSRIPGNVTVAGLAPYELKTVALEVCTSAGCTVSGAVASRTLMSVPTGAAAPNITAIKGGTSVQVEFSAPAKTNGILTHFIALVDGSKTKVSKANQLKIVVDGQYPHISFYMR